MNLERIKEIINSEISNGDKEFLILKTIAADKRAIPIILEILNHEREQKNEMLTDMNLLLSKADVGLDDQKYNKDGFMQKEIAAFYKKYKNKIGHCFKNYNNK